MPRRRRDPRPAFVLAVLAAGAAAAALSAAGRESERTPARPASWQGLAGGARPTVALGQRMIVVLKAPSLADRVGGSGGRATERQERRWSRSGRAAQNLLLSRLAIQGVQITPDFRYTRVLNGFAAPLDARALSLLERDPDVAGVYQVRAAYPASIPSGAVGEGVLGPGAGLGFRLPGFDGRGVTIALLDTGVDRAHPFLRGRVLNGTDIVGGQTYALAGPKPDNPSELERHGTEMAGLLVGSGGSSAAVGVAPGASVLPIRVAGWQRDASGSWSIYARTDQLVAGLEHAVDPNGDGDAHDAARIALVALASPFAAFADDPVALAASGAMRLDTLVVVPAGNDGSAAGPAFGSVSGPGGAPAALTVGAVDSRRAIELVRVVARTGLEIVHDAVVPLGGAVAPTEPLTLEVATPRQGQSRPGRRRANASPTLDQFFTRDGRNLVVGRAALVPAGESPGVAVANAARAGAAAVLVDESRLPGGALGLDETVSVPVVGLPAAAARALLDASGRGESTAVSIGAPRRIPNPAVGRVAAFSSSGLAFDGRVKPDVVAPGVGLTTVEAGRDDGAARLATVNGSSAAAALTAGAAALLAQARPSLDAFALKSLMVTSARPLRGEPVPSQGAGLVDLAAATAAGLVVSPGTLALGHSEGARWSVRQPLRIENASPRPVRVRLAVVRRAEGAAVVELDVRPREILVEAGRTRFVALTARVASARVGVAPAEGVVVVRPVGGTPLRVPWAITFSGPRRGLLGPVRLSTTSFRPSDDAPAVLTLRAGRIRRAAGGFEVQPLDRLDIELWRAKGERLGLLARLRDVLPGRYSFGITGRGPAGQLLGRGVYRLRVVAVPTGHGAATERTLRFRIA